ncbi:uncharacterized protein LOC135841890 [Planococcus citri]|uniref:uncharacterized protein LOC135841890 n=1 Tax=Planococcus citri TaxID=170843 RepID=UPI0031F7DF70
MKLFKSFLSISIFFVIFLKCARMTIYDDEEELPTDVKELQQIIRKQSEDIKYLNEVVLGEIPVPHRRTVFNKMKEMDNMTEEEFNNRSTGVEVEQIRYMYFPNTKNQGSTFKFPHPFYVISKSGHLLAGIPISKQPNLTERYISVKLNVADYRSFLLLSQLVQIDERRDLTVGTLPIFEIPTEKEYVDFKINEFYAGYNWYGTLQNVSKFYT